MSARAWRSLLISTAILIAVLLWLTLPAGAAGGDVRPICVD